MNRLASTFADEMLKEGIYVIGFSYPVVPKGKARIRVQVFFLRICYISEMWEKDTKPSLSSVFALFNRSLLK